MFSGKELEDSIIGVLAIVVGIGMIVSGLIITAYLILLKG